LGQKQYPSALVRYWAAVRAEVFQSSFLFLSSTSVFQLGSGSGQTIFKFPNIAKPYRCTPFTKPSLTTMKKIFIVLFLLCLKIFSYGQDTMFINAEELNIRDGAGTKFGVIGKARQGDKIVVISTVSNWSEIETQDGTKGFVSTKFLSTTTQTNSPRKKGTNIFVSALILLGIVGYGIYKIKKYLSGLFGNNSSNKKAQRKSYTNNNVQSKPTDTFHLSIKDGVVNLGKERSTMRETAFHYFDKAIDCDLEDPKNDRSRFLVVTTKGEIILCKLKSTGKEFVFKPFVSFGSAYKAQFADNTSFIFTTEKGTYKGYFNSTRKDKLS
jgi:uncharacterized protein YraI